MNPVRKLKNMISSNIYILSAISSAVSRTGVGFNFLTG